MTGDIGDEQAEEPQQRRSNMDDEFNVDVGDDEMDDFIDDDEGGEGGQRQRQNRRQESQQGVSSRGVQVSYFPSFYFISSINFLH